jgi:CubicO group peptidase (beta-lactamase class C family)
VQGRPAGETDHNNAEVLAMVAQLRELNFDPGEDYEYSNTGFIVAATLLERASGKSLQAFTDARIFKPLGMESTRWREDHRAVLPGRASAYSGTLATGFGTIIPSPGSSGAAGYHHGGRFPEVEAALQAGPGRGGGADSLERAGDSMTAPS